MKRFYLTGHNTFNNRGCEAIVRGTVTLLKEQFGDIEVLVPSLDMSQDAKQWPDAAEQGVRFVPAFYPAYGRFWVRSQSLPIPMLKQAGWPFPLPPERREMLDSVDAVLSIGGDNYSLDYRLPSLLMGQENYAMSKGIPVFLWGASVGPFEAEPSFVPAIKNHLAKMSNIASRETVTKSYLEQTLGLDNVTLMADPAFKLEPEATELAPFWPSADADGVLGLNVSPLIQRYRAADEPKEQLISEVTAFVKNVFETYKLNVVLIPHVVPLDGGLKNNDAVYMQEILEQINDPEHLTMTPTDLNAAQTKYVISQCRFFIGARTHSTIAALSSGVPTTSIAYSVKAKGINRDLFGHTDYVLETPDVSSQSLSSALDSLISNETAIRTRLKEQRKELRARAVTATETLRKHIEA